MLDKFSGEKFAVAARWQRVSFLCACFVGVSLTLGLKAWVAWHPLAASVSNVLLPPGAALSSGFALTPPYTSAKTITKEWPQKFAFANKSLKEKKEGKYWYELKVEYPQIKDARNQQTRRFNQWIAGKVLGSAARFKGLVKMTKRKKLPHTEWGLWLTYVIYYSDENLISLRLSHSVMEAGQMHPIDYYETLNYDLRQGRILKITDVFRSEAGFLRAVSDFSRQELARTYGLFDDWSQGGTEPERKNFLNWNLVPDGVIIAFDDYQIQCHAFGQAELIAPFSAFGKTLRSSNFVAKTLAR
jgi:hypothetical protein